MEEGYRPYKRGDKVKFMHWAVWKVGTVTEVHLNPNRKPGRDRVSYEIRFSPTFQDTRVQAKNVFPVGPNDTPRLRPSAYR